MKGHCRLCWAQARLDRSASLGGAAGTYLALLPWVREVRWQQLSFAGMPAPRDLHPKPDNPLRGVGHGAKGVSRKQPPPVVARPDSRWQQLPLLPATSRTYRWARHDMRTHPAFDNPWLAWARHLAHGLGEVRGWRPPAREAVDRALVMLLADHADGDQVTVSDFAQLVCDHNISLGHLMPILQAMDIVNDDRQPAFDRWLDTKTATLPPPISRHVHDWARTLHDGGPRVAVRDQKTVRLHVARVIPALLGMPTDHQHLREVDRDDVLTVLAPLQGHDRIGTLKSMRSLFRWAKRSGLIFRDPTARIRGQPAAATVPQPLTDEQIAPTIEAATTRHARVAIVLAAVHAARHGDILNLQLDDVDLGNRVITIGGHQRPIDALTYQVLRDWLDYRQQRWPTTANPHLLVTRESAIRLGPPSLVWLGRILRGLPATLERLRIDRHLDEALHNGADPLHLAAVFGISDTTAIKYATAARHLLDAGPALHTGNHPQPTDTPTPSPPHRPPGSR